MVTSQAGHVCRGVQAEKELSQPLYKAIHHGCCQDYRFWGEKNTQPRTAKGIKPGILKHRGKNEPNFLFCYPVFFYVALSVTPVTLPLCIYSSKGFMAEWLLRPWLLHGDHAALGTECGGRQSQVSPDDTLPIMNFFAPCM